MPIAMSNGRTYENSLDMLFAKDMPSREETDKQQRDKRMKEIDETMPPDMRGPPPVLHTPEEQDYYQHQEQFPKDQNDPSTWGMDESIGRTGPAMVPNKDPEFHEVLNHMDYLIDPEGVQKAQAQTDLTTKLRQRFGNPPPAARMFVDTVLGNKNKITENDFTSEEIDHLRAVADKQLNLGKNVIGYGDYNPEEKGGKYEKSFELGKGGSQMFMDALTDLPSSLSFTLGMAKVRREDDGTIVINDRYHWAAPEAKVQELKDQGSWAVLKKIGEGLRDNGLLGVGNVIGNLVAPKEGGRDVEIRIPPKGQQRTEDDSIPPNARPTSAELPEEKSAYQNFTDKLEELSKTLNPSFIPTAEQFRDAPWKEKLGFIIASSMMFAGPGRGPKGSLPSGKSDPLASWTEGLAEFDKANPPIIKTLEAAEKEGSQTAANLLGEYRKIDDPVVRAEFSKIVKDKIASASEGGETTPSDITNPTIRGMKEGSDWSEVITKPDGTKETVYDTAKIERLRNLLDNGLTFTEIGEQMGVSRNSVNSMVRRVRNMDAAEGDVDSQRILSKAEEAKFRRQSGIHVDRIPEIRDLLKDGESLASIAKKLDIPAPSVRLLVRNNNELNSLRTTSPTSNWTPSQDKLLTRWYNDPNSDLFGTPPGLGGRSPASIERRIKVLGLDKQ